MNWQLHKDSDIHLYIANAEATGIVTIFVCLSTYKCSTKLYLP